MEINHLSIETLVIEYMNTHKLTLKAPLLKELTVISDSLLQVHLQECQPHLAYFAKNVDFVGLPERSVQIPHQQRWGIQVFLK